VPTVYSKPDCVQCKMSKRYLDQRGIEYQEVDVTESDEALIHIKELGYLAVPVVEVGEDHWSGFRPDRLSQLVA